MPNILFVCTGNLFRSPIAEACFKRELAAHGLEHGWQVSSTGTWAINGLPPARPGLDWAQRHGLDIVVHRTRLIDRSIAAQADLILVMEGGHKEALCSELPDLAYWVHLLSEAVTGVSYGIPDVSPSASAEEICNEINELISRGFERICSLAGHV